MTLRIGVATAAEVPDLDDEGLLFLKALRERGLAAEPVVWDADVAWTAYDLVVVRSTWDYARRPAEFLAWTEHVGSVTTLLNGADVIRWNTDKRYLADLERAGIPIVPTQFLAPGDAPAHAYEDVEHVVKPVVSAGSRDTLRIGPERIDRSHKHVGRLLAAGRSVMVQPYLHDVDEHGETALLYIDGTFSHAMRKGPLLLPDMELVEELFAQEEMARRDPSPAERELADAVLAAVPPELAADLLYTRVDLLPSPDGPRLLELELTEPSLFLDHHPPAAEALADAVVRRLG
jgi:hypothetical protein